MNRKLLMLVLFASIAVAACKPQAPAEPAAPAAPEAPAEPAKTETMAEPSAPVAVESSPATSAADVPFDVKGFAGVFSGTLPCADCPGIDTRITFNADGTYKLHETFHGKPGNGNGDGTWTAEENGKRIRLDPNSKSEQDRLFAVTSKDQIDALDLEGKAPESKLPSTLKREGAMPTMQ
jgi:copper homeostasis protein (lipoprotein)